MIAAMIFGIHPFLNECINQSEMINAMIMPITGARKINITVLRIGSEFTVPKPPNAMAAPEKAPINVWEEEDGMPNHQVSRFQKIAAKVVRKK
jgi:hypothetical protein